MVVQDSNALVLASMVVIKKRVATLFTIEALTCICTIRLVKLFGLSKVEVERDSLTIIKKCQKEGVDKSKIGGYIQEIQEDIGFLTSILFQFISRDANLSARIVAIKSLKKGESFYLASVIPPFATKSLGMPRQQCRELD